MIVEDTYCNDVLIQLKAIEKSIQSLSNHILENHLYNCVTRDLENGELDTELNIYQDDKYVRAAGNYLWLGVLMALDAVFHVREDRRTRVDIKDYRDAVGKRDKKLLALINSGYDVMHLYMNYDGNQSKGVSDEGFRLANNIIDRCAVLVN